MAALANICKFALKRQLSIYNCQIFNEQNLYFLTAYFSKPIAFADNVFYQSASEISKVLLRVERFIDYSFLVAWGLLCKPISFVYKFG